MLSYSKVGICIPITATLPGPSGMAPLIDMDDEPPSSTFGQHQRTQILLEEEANMQQLQERENSIRQLEVCQSFQ